MRTPAVEHEHESGAQIGDLANGTIDELAHEDPAEDIEFRTTGDIPDVLEGFDEQAGTSVLAFGETGPAAAPATATAKPKPKPEDYKKSPRGDSFSDQVTKPASPSYDTLANAKTVGGQALSTVNTTKDEAKILNALRAKDRRFNAVALAAAQGALGVANATGAFNTETLRKLVARKGAQTADSIVEDATWTGLYTGTDLFFAAVDGRGDTYDSKKPDTKHRHKADRSARGMGYKNYSDYAASLQDFSFLGTPGEGQVQAHLASRLKAAETFLIHRHGTAEKAIEKTGWKGKIKGSYDTGESDRAKGHAHYHTMGLAIDIDAGQNPWLYPESELKRQRTDKVKTQNKEIEDGTKEGDLLDAADAGAAAADWWTTTLDVAFMQAAAMFEGFPLTKDKMLEWSKTLSTEELHARVKSASTALKKYYDLAKTGDDKKILAAFKAAGFTDADATKALPDMKKFPGRFDGGFKRGNVSGKITNQGLDLVVALRDVAGLNWGATEMSSGDNGDMMHFDCRDTGLGKDSRDFKD